MKRVAVIMAGGSGERFWPLSRRTHPKQLLSLGLSDKSMIEEAIDRVSRLIAIDDIFIITSEVLLAPIREAIPNLPSENVVAEPAKRNTAPCLALSSAYLMDNLGLDAKDISVAVLTADHIMQPIDKFIDTVDSALSFVEKNESIATIGINPTRAETGYGYVELGEVASDKYKAEISSVSQFKEKPNLEIAMQYLEAGNYLWNSGMFFYRLDYFNSQLEKYLPEVGCKINDLKVAYSKSKLGNSPAKISTIFEAFPNISIDFALMEKADNVVCVKALFEWDDIGDLNSLERTKSSDKDGNINLGKVSAINSKNNILINDTKKDMILSGVNIENLVVVVTDDAVLVCNRDNVQDVKLAVKDIRENHNETYL